MKKFELAKKMSKCGSFAEMYCDEQDGLVRSRDKNTIVSYCASPVVLTRKAKRSLLAGNDNVPA